MQVKQQFKSSFYDEPDLSSKEKQKNIKIVQFGSIIYALFSILLIILPFIFQNYLSLSHKNLLIFAGGVSNLILSIISLCWSKSKSIIKQADSIYGAEYQD